MPQIHRALISVSDKRGLIEFAQALRSMGVEIISTGNTHAVLTQHGIDAHTVSEITRFPEILDGRVKTLHPSIYGGLLAVTDNERHMQQLHEHQIASIDMVVVNLYPFEQTVARNGISLEEAIEQIDIGGPSMIRAAAKNFRHKAVIISPDAYPAVIDEMRAGSGCLAEATCFRLAREVFRRTSAYDSAIAGFLDHAGEPDAPFPGILHVSAEKELDLRYGENPHQHAALYGNFTSLFRKLHGKELSFNNIVDIAAAASLIGEFDDPAVAIIKHTNPCGVAIGNTLAEAYARAVATDSASAFGGIIAVNRPLDPEAAARMNEIFTEVIVAPEFGPETLALLQKKKDRRLILQTVDLRTKRNRDVRSVPGGYLVQDPDSPGSSGESFTVVTERAPTAAEVAALRFAWRVTKHVKSNAIVYTTADRTLGVGAGQMSRVDSAKIAGIKAAVAGLDLHGSVVGSDAFFPFADGLLETVKAGATAVIQPGGSVRDAEVIRAANENEIAMVFTGTRHFRH